MSFNNFPHFALSLLSDYLGRDIINKADKHRINQTPKTTANANSWEIKVINVPKIRQPAAVNDIINLSCALMKIINLLISPSPLSYFITLIFIDKINGEYDSSRKCSHSPY